MTDQTTVNPEAASTKPVPTKQERLDAITAQITKLSARYDDILNDRVTANAAKVVALPEVGANIGFRYGRTTPTSQPVILSGVVLAVKPAVEVAGKKLPAQVKVQVGDGFDAELVTIYPAQILLPPSN